MSLSGSKNNLFVRGLSECIEYHFFQKLKLNFQSRKCAVPICSIIVQELL